MAEYLEAMEAHAQANDPEAGKAKKASPGLMRFVKAHHAATD